MKAPLIRRPHISERWLARERGVTMVLVAVAMIAIIAIAALSIDVITLYLAREEAQHSADAAALAALRILSVSGMTGDPSNSSTLRSVVCGGSNSIASQTAQGVGTQNPVGGPVPTVSVTYSAPGGSQTHRLHAACEFDFWCEPRGNRADSADVTAYLFLGCVGNDGKQRGCHRDG